MKVVIPKRWFPTPKMKQKPTTLVFHATAGASATSSIAWLWQLFTNARKGDEASYHYIIERDGTIFKLTPLSNQAWHAGKSVGPSGKHANRYSFGIAFANFNNGETLTLKQIESALWLARVLTTAYPSIEWVTTHRLVSWGRKTDPKGFDLLEFAKESGLKPWRESTKHPWM